MDDRKGKDREEVTKGEIRKKRKGKQLKEEWKGRR